MSQRYTSSGGCLECLRLIAESRVGTGYYEKYYPAIKRYYQKNKERLRAKSKERYHSDKERARKNNQSWRNRNPERSRAINNNYRHRRKINGGESITSSELAAWTSQQKKVCYWCGAKCPKNFHLDHYEPLSRGGKHTKENFVIACANCNLRKHAQDPIAFANRVGKLF